MTSIKDIPLHFWSKVKFVGASKDDCWEWDDTLNSSGYGRFRFSNKDDRAHRVAWILSFGEIPNNKFVLHKCDNRKCVNPKHLFLGSQEDNMKDMAKKGRAIPFIGIGEKNPRAKLKEWDVLEIRKLYNTGKYTLVYLSNIYNVSDTQIGWIVNKKSWKHLS